jgi:hypothetical protein
MSVSGLEILCGRSSAETVSRRSGRLSRAELGVFGKGRPDPACVIRTSRLGPRLFTVPCPCKLKASVGNAKRRLRKLGRRIVVGRDVMERGRRDNPHHLLERRPCVPSIEVFTNVHVPDHAHARTRTRHEPESFPYAMLCLAGPRGRGCRIRVPVGLLGWTHTDSQTGQCGAPVKKRLLPVRFAAITHLTLFGWVRTHRTRPFETSAKNLRLWSRDETRVTRETCRYMPPIDCRVKRKAGGEKPEASFLIRCAAAGTEIQHSGEGS